MKAIELYLGKHAEADIRLASAVQGKWSKTVVVPVCGEEAFIGSMVDSLIRAAEFHRVLAIFVINNRESADQDLVQNNRSTYDGLKLRLQNITFFENSMFGSASDSIDFLVLDRFTHPLPDKHGVGLARKIGSDVAMQIYKDGKITSDWVSITDADVVLPKDYFARQSEDKAAVAAVFPFVHDAPYKNAEPSSSEYFWNEAIKLYDQSLRYYVEGLKFAGSPYAHFSIGSTIAYRQEAYAKVLGMPKLLAAEDFYFLNKIAKTGRIDFLDGEPLHLSGRPSTRVPFGTGMSVIKIGEKLSHLKSHEDYPWQCFELLKNVITSLDSYADDAAKPFMEILRSSFTSSANFEICESFFKSHLSDLAKLHSQSPAASRRRRHLHDYFDGFRTLKFVHHVRDQISPV